MLPCPSALPLPSAPALPLPCAVAREYSTAPSLPASPSAAFVDVQGWLNQHVGRAAQRVVRMVLKPFTIHSRPRARPTHTLWPLTIFGYN